MCDERKFVIIIFTLKTLIVMIPEKVTLTTKASGGPLSKCLPIQGLVLCTFMVRELNQGENIETFIDDRNFGFSEEIINVCKFFLKCFPLVMETILQGN